MRRPAKRVFAFAMRSETYWKLSDAEKLPWMIERIYATGMRPAKKSNR
jgi:hypothetical protein